MKKLFLMALVVSLFLSVSSASHAATTTFVVDNNHDGSGGDSNPGNCICEHGDDQDYGACPLRAAIEEANACASSDIVITFESGLGTYFLVDDLPAIINTTSTITIDGNGAVIDGSRTGPDTGARAFQTAGGTNVTIKDITIQNTYTTTTGGPAIYNQGTLTLQDAVIDSNRAAEDLNGGAIYNDGTLTITGTTISNNAVLSCSVSGTPKGNGVFTSVSLTIENSTLNNNGISGGDGACTLGGAIAFDTHEVYVNVINSTLSGNFAKKGSGVYANSSDIGIIVLKSTTVAHNDNDEGSTLQAEGTTTFTLENSIVSANTSSGNPVSVSPDCYGTFSSAGHNLLSNVLETCFFLSDATDVFVSDAGLGDLANNGGATKTHALNSDSSAINVGSDSVTDISGVTILTTDQAGLPRLSGGVGDMGAFEYQFTDADADGYFADATETTIPSDIDCDDISASVFPGATEICGDGIDQDCSGTDEDCPVEDVIVEDIPVDDVPSADTDSSTGETTGTDTETESDMSSETTIDDTEADTSATAISDTSDTESVSSIADDTDVSSETISDVATEEEDAVDDDTDADEATSEEGAVVEDDSVEDALPDDATDETIASSGATTTTSPGSSGCQLNALAKTPSTNGLGVFLSLSLVMFGVLRRRASSLLVNE